MFGKRFSIGKTQLSAKILDFTLKRVRQSKSVTIAFSIVAVLSTAFESVEIGDHTIFGENVKIYDQNHKIQR